MYGLFNPIFFKSKFPKEPKIKMRTVTSIYPPPGLNLALPGLFKLKLLLVFIIDWKIYLKKNTIL